jgi:hypothetical protein
MAEINLLKNPGTETSIWKNAAGWAVKFLVCLVAAVIGYYGYLFFKVKSVNNKITEIQNSIQQSKSESLTMKGREEFLTRQDQLKQFLTLSSSHLYFSKLLPVLAKVTLKTAYYSKVSVTPEGKMDMLVVVPTLEDLDKFLQVFDQPEVVKNFYNVHINGYNKSQDESGTVYTFNVQLDFNPGLLHGSPQ